VQQPDVARQVVDLTVWNDVLVVGQDNAVVPYAAGWLDTLGGVLNGDLKALCTIGIDLYAGGSFPGSVVRWDNWRDEWVQLGGSPGTINHERNYMTTLCPYDGHLVAGGDFTVPTILASEDHCSNIGLWDGEAWHRMGCGFNNTVYDLAVFDGDLYAAGAFDYAGGAPAAHLARWDGETWHDVGGTNGEVNALTVWNGELVIAGSFSQVDGMAASRIAAWDGAAWHTVGAGLGGTVQDLLVHEDELYAGGAFHDTANRVARWDGSQWQPLGLGVDSIVYALGSHGGDLYAGGYFTNAGGAEANHIARWDGESWHPLGDGLDGTGMTYIVRVMKSVGGDLVVGGEFTDAGGAPASAVAVWDGVGWNEYEGGVQGGYWRTIVYDMQIHDGDLFLGGDFSTVGGRSEASYNLARWVDGTLVPVFLRDFQAAWSDEQVELSWQAEQALQKWGFRLEARCGSATWSVPYRSAGDGSYRAEDAPPRTDQPREVIYTLSYQDDGAMDPMQLDSRAVELPPLMHTRLNRVFPNPCNPGTTISFTLKRASRVDLDVFDATGRRVAHLANRPFIAGDHEVFWDGRDDQGRVASSGAYLVRLESEEGVQSAKIVVVK